MDGASMSNVIADFGKLLDGIKLDPIIIQYKDYAEWQQNFFLSELYKSQKQFWINNLKGYHLLNLPYDEIKLESEIQDNSSFAFVLPEDIYKELMTYVQRKKTTLYITLLCFYSILLHKITGQKDILVGTPTSGRNHPELEPLVGMFVNFLPIRNEINEEWNFDELLVRITQNTLEVFENKDFQYDQIISNLVEPQKKLIQNLIHAVLVVQNYEASGENYDGTISSMNIKGFEFEKKSSPFDLILGVYPNENNISFQFDFNPSKFRIKTIELIKQYFETLILSVLKNPEGIISAMQIGLDADRINQQINKTELPINFNL